MVSSSFIIAAPHTTNHPKKLFSLEVIEGKILPPFWSSYFLFIRVFFLFAKEGGDDPMGFDAMANGASVPALISRDAAKKKRVRRRFESGIRKKDRISWIIYRNRSHRHLFVCVSDESLGEIEAVQA